MALEAMSFGKPVILGDGFPEFFRGEPQNVTALYVDSIKPQKIAEGIQTLLDDHERASEMGKAAFRLIRDSFDWKKTFTETIAVYQKQLIVYMMVWHPPTCMKERNRWFKNGFFTKGINHYSGL